MIIEDVHEFDAPIEIVEDENVRFQNFLALFKDIKDKRSLFFTTKYIS